MDSKTYWAQREAEALKHRITDEKQYSAEIKRIYQDMLDACQKEIDSFYAKYASKEGISIAEAKKLVKKADIASYERKAKRYVREKDFSAKANEEMRLYNAMMKINRLEMLKANIGLELIAGHEELEKFMAKILQGRTMDELARQAGILGKTVRNNAQKAHAIVNGSFHNGTFSDRIWQYQDLMREDLGRLLQTGLIQGKNPRAIAKDLKKYWFGNDPRTGGGATYCMERLMRTELARVQTEAQKQSFIRNGFGKYTFIVNGGCCPVCEALSGKHFNVAKMMPGENAPPMHPNCRCSVAAYEDTDEYEAWLVFLEKGGTTVVWNDLKSRRMAKEADSSNDWSNTVPRTITKSAKRELIQYAADNGINIPELNNFDGDPEVMRSVIDALSKSIALFPVKKKITLSIGKSHDDDVFGETVDGHITLNAKILRDRNITKQNVAADSYFASTCVEDIVVHEYGHIISYSKGNKGIEISGKAYYNVFKEAIDQDRLLDFLESNISTYSTTCSKNKYTEIIPEILAKNNSNPDKFTEEFCKLLKEGYFNETA